MADPTDSNPKVETPGGEKDKKPIKRGVLPNAPNLTSSGRDRRPTQVDITKDVQALRINDEVTREAEAAPIDDRRSSQESGLVIEGVRTSYDVTKKSGKGSFGVVYQAVERDTQNVVAIKRVLQDPRYKNRELQIMKMLDHTNCVKLLDSFCVRSGKGEVFLNLVLAFIPKNLYEVGNFFVKQERRMPHLDVKIYVYQICRALAYVHSLGICHRDIKPQNLLVDPTSRELKLCDFGSAKILVKGEPNVSYICSRYYRAPELIFGASDYTTAIDVWSSGCVMAELILSQPIFAGESGIDQLVEIIRVLGTPTREQIREMSPEYSDYKQFPSIKARPWKEVFLEDTPALMLDLVSKMLVYPPTLRILPMTALCHPLFDELRTHGHAFPFLFDFTDAEKSFAQKNEFLDQLLPRFEAAEFSTKDPS